MSLINCKVKLKLKWIKYFVLSGNGNKNVSDNDDANNIICNIKNTKICFSCNFISKKELKIIQTS